MEQGTLIGNLLAVFFLAFAIMFDTATFSVNVVNIFYFIDTGSFLIVMGGTVASTFISHAIGDAKGFFGLYRQVMEAEFGSTCRNADLDC